MLSTLNETDITQFIEQTDSRGSDTYSDPATHIDIMFKQHRPVHPSTSDCGCHESTRHSHMHWKLIIVVLATFLLGHYLLCKVTQKEKE